MSRVVVLPDRGTVLAATDLHGNLPDFHAVVRRFLDLCTSAADPPHLLLCGDLVHGPALARDDWPEHLGDWYADESVELLDEAWRLQRRFPGQVHYLLGNHEHAHLGGPLLSKFHPDEARHLEESYGTARFGAVRDWFAGWPLAVVAPAAGIAFTHAAPHAVIASAADVDAAPLTGYEDVALHDMAGSGVAGALLWARTTTAERATAFLRALHPGCRVAVFGHDVIREGHLVEHEPLLCVSTSYGCYDGDKVLLEWDLAVPAASAAAVARTGLRPVHPAARPVHRHPTTA
ncbi:metallophosphoesterase [Dactylosporangium sp. NPDC049525]|uniref:metallophosphoesterase n=1 Tax=Dactylosporangium sp. NPDC049525 TaxID=3154730 RepID=UPI00341FD742